MPAVKSPEAGASNSDRFGRTQSDGALSRWEHRSEWPMVGLSLVFLTVIILPYAHPLTPQESLVLHVVDVSLWMVFVLDYMIRFLLASDRRRFVSTHWFDLLIVIVPFLRPLRIVRVIALVVATGRRAGSLIVQQVLIYVLLLVIITTSSCAILVYHFENSAAGANIHSLSDAFWWALTTVTTVGYGDRYPVTPAGRGITVVLMIAGIVLMGTITAAIAAKFVDIVRGKTATEFSAAQTQATDKLIEEVSKLTLVVEAIRIDVASIAPRTNDSLES